MENDGIIPDCSTAGCWEVLGTRRCCDFQQGNFIVLYPGELDQARATGLATDHLQITDPDYHGGQKVVCRAIDTASCDGGFKPLDCLSYPFFPAVPHGGPVDVLLKGKKCPLAASHQQQHAARVRNTWNDLLARNPAVGPWLDRVRLVGYTDARRPSPSADLVQIGPAPSRLSSPRASPHEIRLIGQ